MPGCQHENKINNSQGNMSSLKPSDPTTAGPEYSNMAEAQDLNKACKSMIGVLK